MWLNPAEEKVPLAQYIYESIVLSLPYRKVHGTGPDGEPLCDKEMLARFRIISQAEFDALETEQHSLADTDEGGKLGLAEKSASRKMLMQDYGLNESFFKEIDASVKRNCRTQNDIQSYLFMYQGFSNDLMMLMGNLMQWKFRMPSIFKKALYGMTQKTVHDVCTKQVWKADDVHKTAATVRQYKERLGYSEQWMTDYVYNIVLLAKKEPKRKEDDTETKK